MRNCFSFWVRTVLRATAPRSFWQAQLPKVLRTWGAFDLQMCFATQRRATVHVLPDRMAPHRPLWRDHFSTLLSLKTLEKHSFSQLVYLFARFDLLSADSLFSDSFSFDFGSSHDCCGICLWVRSLTSKLPSIMEKLGTSLRENGDLDGIKFNDYQWFGDISRIQLEYGERMGCRGI